MNTWQEGSRFGPYELLQRLGSGGFGEVWLSRNTAGRSIALKILNGQYQSNEAARLRAEIELLAGTASSRSRHIVRVLGGSSDPAPHIVMEYIDGVDVASEIARRGSLPVVDVVRIAEGIADALVALQQAGIIHRDVKPGNVMIDTSGVVKLTDFGIAKIVGLDSITATNQITMSVAYAAPDVFDGKSSFSSDYYAFGALLYHCLTGRPPFIGNYAEVMRQHFITIPDLGALPSDTPMSLRELIDSCLAKRPDDRPATASALVTAVQAIVAQLSAGLDMTLRQLRLQEPKQLGPWIIEARKNENAWTFACHHESSGQKASVEVRFADDLGYGQQLRIENPNRSSRLLLRPGEGWGDAPASAFFFWVADIEVGPRVIEAPIAATEIVEAPAKLPSLEDTVTPVHLFNASIVEPNSPSVVTPRPTSEAEVQVAKVEVGVPVDRTRRWGKLPYLAGAVIAAAVAGFLILLPAVSRHSQSSLTPTVVDSQPLLPSGSSQELTIPPEQPPAQPAAAVLVSTSGHIAFFSRRDQNREIYVMDGDGANQRNITNMRGEDFDASWSRDGRRIAFTAFRNGNYDIYVMEADGSRMTRLTTSPAPDYDPSWSPDGRRLAFRSERDGNSEIYVMDADGSRQTRLTYDPANDSAPAWSPDGSRIAFSTYRDGNFEIYLMDPDGSHLVNLTNNAGNDGNPAWSPEGRRIAFSSDRDGKSEIYVMNADGVNPTRLTNNSDFSGRPAWSPDGTRIAFASLDGRVYDVYVMNADGSAVTRLTTSPADNDWPTWGP